MLMPYGNRLYWLYMAAIFWESVLVGWLLSNYNAHWLTLAGTQAVTLHLAWVGSDAIALAVAWIVAVVWGGALAYAWPRSFQGTGIAVWAGSLGLGWVLGLILVLTLAFAKKAMKSVDWSNVHAFWLLILVTWLGFGIGRIIDRGFLFGFSN
ncbi:hypothetical protein [Lyngbya aestuarii]|uniref:hypothetical protein n=1 Tax=Lyngbya aestuarii TaxID=118322 RepID=UPI00403D75DE